MLERVTPLRLCTIVDSDGETIQPYVRCPRRDETIDALACTGCARMRSIEWDPSRGGEVTCMVEAHEPPKTDRRADVGELASRVSLHEVVAPTTVCVKTDLPLAQLKHVVKEKGARAVAVVDEERKLLGLLSLVDLATMPDFGCVADVTSSSRVHALLDDSPLAHAIALMAAEELSEVPVVRADGTLIGIYYAVDALRWVATRMGYVIREPARPSTDSLSKEGPP